MPKTRDKSETFCRHQGRPRMLRLPRLGERAADTGTALGSDVMATAPQGYAPLKAVGKNQGLERLRQSLGTRFRRSSRPAETKAA